MIQTVANKHEDYWCSNERFHMWNVTKSKKEKENTARKLHKMFAQPPLNFLICLLWMIFMRLAASILPNFRLEIFLLLFVDVVNLCTVPNCWVDWVALMYRLFHGLHGCKMMFKRHEMFRIIFMSSWAAATFVLVVASSGKYRTFFFESQQSHEQRNVCPVPPRTSP